MTSRIPQLAIQAGLAIALAAVAVPRTGAEPVRLARDFDGVSAEVEVRGLEASAAREAAHAALDAIWRVQVMLRGPGEGTLPALHAAPPREEVVLHEELARELTRAMALCIWSGGAWGPLGGPINALWRGPRPAPEPSDLREAVGRTGCRRLQLVEEQPPRARLDPGSEVDLSGIARGWAADEAVEALLEEGVRNGIVVIGNVVRAMGAGPDGRGWPITLPVAPGDSDPMGRFWLRDRSVAFHTLDTVGHRPIVDQRTGVPARGVAAVAVVAEGGADAQGLATSLFILGHREGRLRLGGLRPRPIVLFVLGEGQGGGVEASYGWYDHLEQID